MDGVFEYTGRSRSASAPRWTCAAHGRHTTRARVAEKKHHEDSEEVGLLHDAQELLLVDLTVAIAVGLVNHLLELLVRHPLAELLGHALQVLEADLPRLVVIEEAEGLEDLVLRVPVQNLLAHHLQELVELDRAGAVIAH